MGAPDMRFAHGTRILTGSTGSGKLVNNEIQTTIRAFIVDELRGGDEPDELDDDTFLIEEEVIDSLGIMSIVTFVEQKWGIEIEADEVVLQNFESLPAIGNLVKSKLQ